MEFYKCEICGNVAIKPYDVGNPLYCCGKPMLRLEANTVDAAVEKHVPAVTIENGSARIQIGEVAHPMIEEHHITFICLETKNGYQIHELSYEDEPRAHFAIASDDEPLRVYEYCNIHGLWVKEL